MTAQILDPARPAPRRSVLAVLDTYSSTVRLFVWLAGAFAAFVPLSAAVYGWGWWPLLGGIGSAGSAGNAWFVHRRGRVSAGQDGA
jgi:hypothetical protein